MDEYIEVNLANWNSRVAHHEHAYGLEQFRTDPAHLSNAVRFDLARLGSIDGLDVVHLQCHIGTDTLSLSRLEVGVVDDDAGVAVIHAMPARAKFLRGRWTP